MAVTFPIIDVFAGPGGLGEGFSSYANDKVKFKIALSIEKDRAAHKTLQLRAFFRQFDRGKVPKEYYEYLEGLITREFLFESYPNQADKAIKEAWLHTLKDGDVGKVQKRAKEALQKFKCEHCVLIGGPPCQAYSIAGRSRMYYQDDFHKDERNFLYTHYLRLVAHLTPALFVMENVKGMLTATVNNETIFDKILTDLENPGAAVKKLDNLKKAPTTKEYDIYSFVTNRAGRITKGEYSGKPLKPQDYIIKSEEYGIPQRRHRVILLGVRKDLDPKITKRLIKSPSVNPSDVLDDLPRIRSGLTKSGNTWNEWHKALEEGINSFEQEFPDHSVLKRMKVAVSSIRKDKLKPGSKFSIRDKNKKPKKLANWYLDPRLKVICNHETKSHMKTDLWRYLFATCFSDVHDRSPILVDYPKNLLPAHSNIDPENKASAKFVDRFKVQISSKPTSTVTSHISKDGHFFIHHDSSQCRAWSIREAARIQTFPDNYFFEGNRTEQYHQVGNAVPPLLAYKIAEVVSYYLSEMQKAKVISR